MAPGLGRRSGGTEAVKAHELNAEGVALRRKSSFHDSVDDSPTVWANRRKWAWVYQTFVQLVLGSLVTPNVPLPEFDWTDYLHSNQQHLLYSYEEIRRKSDEKLRGEHAPNIRDAHEKEDKKKKRWSGEVQALKILASRGQADPSGNSRSNKLLAWRHSGDGDDGRLLAPNRDRIDKDSTSDGGKRRATSAETLGPPSTTLHVAIDTCWEERLAEEKPRQRIVMQEPVPQLAHDQGLRILVVEDNVINQKVLTKVLDKYVK